MVDIDNSVREILKSLSIDHEDDDGGSAMDTDADETETNGE